MATTNTSSNLFSKILNPTWLTGPILDKELRVSSRRKRSYSMRFTYIAIMTVFVAFVWASMVEFHGSAAYRISRMSEAGLAITCSIVWFQFIATQLLAVIMLSTSVSDEVYHRTLGLLMTTPITGFQIIMGKLFSRLLQLMLLLAISLPLLAIVRVFGGVPWSFVLSSLCITLTAVIFAGTVSLCFSITGRRAYAVILKTFFALGALYGFVPMLVALAFANAFAYMDEVLDVLVTVFLHINPFAAMQTNTMMLFSPQMLGSYSFFWPIHCAIMLGASALLLTWAVRVVRKVALKQVTGQVDIKTAPVPAMPVPAVATQVKPPVEKSGAGAEVKPQAVAPPAEVIVGVSRSVKGPPVVWRELRAPIIHGGKTKTIIGVVVVLLVLLLTYALTAEELGDEDTHAGYAVVFVLIGLLTNTVFAATTIASEKESRSWPILLTTALTDTQIIFGKAVGVFRRCAPVWLLLIGHLLLFAIIGYMHPIALVQVLMIVISALVFLSGTGLYFSARLKRTTSAVVANLGTALGLWGIVPMLLGMATSLSNNEDIAETILMANPVVQIVVCMEGSAGSYNANDELRDLSYYWPLGDVSCGETSLTLLISMLVYATVGVLFAWRAKCLLRRNIF